MRIAKALSALGYSSRRDGERLIAAGRVRVNGERVTNPVTLVNLSHDRVTVDGEPTKSQPAHRYVALHKPRGVTSTTRDRHAERTVVELVPSSERLYPVGRLDKDSEGLILLTNDGALANAITHPRYGMEREYLVLVEHAPSPQALGRLRRGVEIDGQRTAPARAEVYRRGREGVWLRLVLREGRNREVRRMLEAVGEIVQRLVRVRIGPVRLGELRPGQYRELREQEIRELRAMPARRAISRGLGSPGAGNVANPFAIDHEHQPTSDQR
jgi:23S rRNA pseudouridine2605 synthase